MDSLSAELNRRVQAYDKIELLFGFLVEFPSKSDDELRLATETFRETFRKKWFILSILQHSWKIVHGDTIPSSQSYELISENMVQSTFPNVLTALRIYRCLMISERTFSKLKILKNCHRASMMQKRLNSLAIMATEYDVLENLDFQNILEDFISTKLRKKNF